MRFELSDYALRAVRSDELSEVRLSNVAFSRQCLLDFLHHHYWATLTRLSLAKCTLRNGVWTDIISYIKDKLLLVNKLEMACLYNADSQTPKGSYLTYEPAVLGMGHAKVEGKDQVQAALQSTIDRPLDNPLVEEDMVDVESLHLDDVEDDETLGRSCLRIFRLTKIMPSNLFQRTSSQILIILCKSTLPEVASISAESINDLVHTQYIKRHLQTQKLPLPQRRTFHRYLRQREPADPMRVLPLPFFPFPSRPAKPTKSSSTGSMTKVFSSCPREVVAASTIFQRSFFSRENVDWRELIKQSSGDALCRSAPGSCATSG